MSTGLAEAALAMSIGLRGGQCGGARHGGRACQQPAAQNISAAGCGQSVIDAFCRDIALSSGYSHDFNLKSRRSEIPEI